MSSPVSTAASDAPTVAAAERSNRQVSGAWLALGLLAAVHFLVDIKAATVNPLWPTLERSLSLKTGGLLGVYVCWTLATSFGQLLVAIWADRRASPWLLWVGPLVAVLCVSCAGLASSVWSLALLLIAGGLGIAAFHPEAAATAGSLLPDQRSRAMALFAVCGYLGQAVGPLYSGAVSDALGVRGLVWGIAWGLPVLFALQIGARWSAVPWKPAPPTSHVASIAGRLPLATLLLLLAVGSLRVVAALGVPLALAYLLEAESASGAIIGAVQSAFMVGIGVGAMSCAVCLRRHWEWTALWLFPMIAAPLLLTLNAASGPMLVLLVGACGFLLGITMPVFISYGQQLLPRGQRVASSITMGVSWGIAGGMVAAATAVCQRLEILSSIFIFFAATSLASSLLCFCLP